MISAYAAVFPLRNGFVIPTLTCFRQRSFKSLLESILHIESTSHQWTQAALRWFKGQLFGWDATCIDTFTVNTMDIWFWIRRWTVKISFKTENNFGKIEVISLAYHSTY